MADDVIDQQHRLDLVLGASRMALWTWEVASGDVTWVGDVTPILGHDVSNWEGTAEELAILPLVEDRAGMAEAVRAALEEDAPYDLQFRIRHPDGSVRWLLSVGKVVRDGDGAPLMMIGSMQDITERKKSEDLRERFVEGVMAAEDAERRRIARELHDGTGQALTSLLVELRHLEAEVEPGSAALERVEGLRVRTSHVLAEVGRMSRGLHPGVLDDLGFVPAVERFVQEFGDRYGVHADLHVNGFDGHLRLPAAVETSLYRILQEALTNVAKHSEAQATSVIVDRRVESIRLIVEDDGQGFREAQHGSISIINGVGLHSIRERVSLLRGNVTLESAPGVGTTLYVRIPLPG